MTSCLAGYMFDVQRSISQEASMDFNEFEELLSACEAKASIETKSI